MKYKYPVYRPCLKGNEKKYVDRCLESTWISSKGEFVKKFEDAFSSYVGSRYAVSAINGTAALHLSLLALGIGAGDEVIVPSLTYVASVNAITYTGATPVFVDSLTDTWQMDPDGVRKKVTQKTRAIMPVHLYGHPCDMERIMSIADDHGLFVVEDCAEAFCSLYRKKHVGTFGDLGVFSFFGNKTITTGEGGMVVTGDRELQEKCRALKNHGSKGAGEYRHEMIGYNYRLTNVASAIGLAQIERADKILLKKRAIAGWYKDRLRDLPVEFQKDEKHVRNSHWMVSILAETYDLRDKLRRYLDRAGIETRPLFWPAHKLPMYRQKEKFPVAEDLSERGLNLPSYPDLKERDVDNICGVISDFYKKTPSTRKKRS